MSKLTRRAVVGGSAAALVTGCQADGSAPSGRTTSHTGGSSPPPPPTTTFRAGRPIIYIYADQVRWNAIGPAGNPVVPTPHLDALAAEAARFSTCLTNGPSCRASRTSMMTGLQVYQHKVDDNSVWPNPKMQSHVRRIRDEAGYHTSVIGKTHLQKPGTGNYMNQVGSLQEWGFSDAIELQDPQEPETVTAYSQWLEDTTPKGETSKWERWIQYVNAYNWFVSPPDLPPTSLTTYDHMDSWCARTADEYIRAYAEDKPLYLQVNFPGPHPPFDATSEFEALIDPNDPAMPLPILIEPQEPIAPLTRLWAIDKLEAWDEPSARLLLQRYYAKIALVDAGIGVVVQALKDTGLWDEAWVIFHSDHGELAADHLFTGKVVPWDGSLRVPLLIRPPGGITSWVDDGQVDTMDTTATLLTLAGLDPTGFGERSLVDRVLAGPAGPQAHETKVVLFENVGSAGVRTETSKLTYDLASRTPVELYDLVLDPDEVVNQVENTDYAETLAALLEQLEARRPFPK